MPKLPQIKSRELVTVVEKLGFVLRSQSGSHAVLYILMVEEQQYHFTQKRQSE